MRSATARILRALALGVSVGLLGVVCLLAVVLVVVPKATGSVPLTVLTSSMTPRLPPGTLVVVRPVSPAAVRVGEVVTYQIASGRPEVVTHRVVGITTTSDGQRSFTFRGDANAAPDASPVRPEQIRGALWYSVPGVGWANEAVNGTARTRAVPLVAGGLLAYAAVMISLGVGAALRRRHRTRYRRTPEPARRRRRHVHLME